MVMAKTQKEGLGVAIGYHLGFVDYSGGVFQKASGCFCRMQGILGNLG
jgi:hypothetical protein